MHTRTVSIFRESRHVLEAIEPPPQYLLDRLYEAVRRPPSELVERHELISRALRMRRSNLGLCFQRFAWPDVAEGNATKSRAVLGPDRREARDEDVPEGCQGNATSCSVCNGLRFEIICCCRALASQMGPRLE